MKLVEEPASIFYSLREFTKTFVQMDKQRIPVNSLAWIFQKPFDEISQVILFLFLIIFR